MEWLLLLNIQDDEIYSIYFNLRLVILMNFQFFDIYIYICSVEFLNGLLSFLYKIIFN